MKNKKTKKGFTLVELLVVITILAVLATVSVIGYRNFTKKAQISNDTSLVAQLNLALQADEAEGGKAATPSEALEVVEEAGYIVPKLTPTTAKYNIIWNQSTNRFALLDEKGNKVAGEPASNAYENWTFVSKYEGDLITKGYSVYLNSDFSGEIPATVNVGIDVGNNKNISTITYDTHTASEAQSVVIRTNGGELNVNAPLDTVEHYGKVGKVAITAVASASYHENGEVEGDIVIEKGRLELTENAMVGTVFVSSVASGDVKIDVENGAIVGTVAPTTENAKSDVENATSIPSESKYTEVVELNTDYAGGLGTERSPYLISNNDHIAKIMAGTAQNKKYYKLIADVEVSSVDGTLENAVLDGANHTMNITKESSLFDSMSSSEIKDLKADIKNSLVRYASNSTFSNVDLSGKIDAPNGNNRGAYVIYAKPINSKVFLTYIDCDCSVDFNYGGASTNYNAVFTGYAYPKAVATELNYTNCSYSGTLVSGKAAMFLGNNSANQGKVTINVNNCVNKGIIQSTYTGAEYCWNSYVATGIKKDANHDSFKNNSINLNGNKLTTENVSETLGTGFIQGPNDANLKLVQNADRTFTLTASQNPNASYYIVTVGLYTRHTEGGTFVQYINERIEKSAIVNNTIITTLKNRQFVDKAWVEENSTATAQTYGEGEYAYTVYTLNGKEYYYLPHYNETYLTEKVQSAQIISVSCYNADGNLIASAALSK